MRERRTSVALLAVLSWGCKPNLNDTVSIVTSPQILAVAAVPAEVGPMGKVTYTALYVGPQGAIATGAVDWAFCTERKPLAELTPVSPLCLQASGGWFVPIGDGTSVAGTIPSDACSQFGPQVPQPQMGQPPGRPVDPDTTGGYYQPIRVLAAGTSGDVIAVGETRLSCGVASVSPDLAAAFAQQYHVNDNPVIAAFGPSGGSSWTNDAEGAINGGVAPGQHLTLEVAWPACPTTDVCGDMVCGPDEAAMACTTCAPSVTVCPADCMPASGAALGCGGAERYVLLDAASGSLDDVREGIEVAWYATAGSFDVDRTGRAGTDPTTTSDDGWTAPAQPGTVTMWIVLRDDRGGVGWAEYAVAVQ